MVNRGVVFLGTLVVLMMVCSPALGASRFKRQSGTLGLGGSLTANSSSDFAAAFQALFNASAAGPIQFQQQLLNIFQNGANVSLATFQNLTATFQNLSSQFTEAQRQRIQNAIDQFKNFVDLGSTALQSFVNVNQALINSTLQTFQNFVNISQVFQNGLNNIISQNPGSPQAAAATALLQLLNNGNFSAGFQASGSLSGGAQTFAEALQFFNNLTSTMSQQANQAIQTIQSFIKLGVNAFNNIFIKPFLTFTQLFGSLFG